ncbi:hypothetical protein ONR57_22590 [Hoyosella sp. YIM 151337]|uniref:hypothetical protein n=1 Tax=Hoyosella sp. YIM 151337 TaxID=2992742 RepID=UPI002235F8D0|nr:hypothetical protein [Hoyosella sp. YIM 151337]MCW4356097.1 hypothetical protein [Hoyosella sp. YIM 151337]
MVRDRWEVKVVSDMLAIARELLVLASTVVALRTAYIALETARTNRGDTREDPPHEGNN